MFHFTTAADRRPDRSDTANHAAPAMLGPAIGDPLVVTLPALGRIARVAVEAASRFARADVSVKTMAWMEAPRPLFGGLSAIEACTEPHHCRRAVTLHGLEMDPDSDASDIDGVMALIDPSERCGAMSAGTGSGGSDRFEAADEKRERTSSARRFAASAPPPVRRSGEEGGCSDHAVASSVRAAMDYPWTAGDERIARTSVSENLAETMAAVARITSYRETLGVAKHGSRLACA